MTPGKLFVTSTLTSMHRWKISVKVAFSTRAGGGVTNHIEYYTTSRHDRRFYCNPMFRKRYFVLWATSMGVPMITDQCKKADGAMMISRQRTV